MCSARNVVFAFRAVVAGDDKFALTFGNSAEFNYSVDFRHHRGFTRTTRFKQFNDTRQTAHNVFCFRRFARNFCDDIARFNYLSVGCQKVGANRHLISFQDFIAVTDFQTRLMLFIRIFDHEASLSRNFINILFNRFAFLQILEFHSPGNFRQNSKRERIPSRQHIVFLDFLPVFDVQMRSVNDLITRHFALAFIEQREFGLAFHRDKLPGAIGNNLHIAEIFNRSVHRRFVFGFLFEPRRAADVESSHRQLRSRFTDGLRGNDTDGFTDFNRVAGRQITPVTFNADSAS